MAISVTGSTGATGSSMARGFQRDGMAAGPGELERLNTLLGRPLRAHRGFAREILERRRQRA